MIRNKLYILLTAFLASGFYACSDDDKVVIDEDNNPERLFMPMFRSERNGVSTSDRFYSGVANGSVNDIQLYWYGVNGASGYHIKGLIQGRDWNRQSDLIVDEIVGPDVLSLKVEDLQYKTGFRFAIQAISPKGEAYNSKWFGLGDGAHPDDYLTINTLDRYDVPDVLWVEDITESSLRVYFNLTSDGNYKEHFEEENGQYIMDQIKVEPSADNPELETQVITLTQADKERGYIDVNNLTSNAVYIINGLNNNIKRYWDRLYNTNMVRMKGEVGEPILIQHIVDPNDTVPAAIRLDACRIDTVLANYMTDNNLAEGTTFLLEGGKTYYLVNSVNMCKGFTLKSNDPNNRPTVYLGIGCSNNGKYNDKDEGTPVSPNFSFGRNAGNGEMGGINVQSIIFQDINFDCEKAYNFLECDKWGAGSGLGNYFINQNSQAMPFGLETFEIRNCDFRRMIRVWIRIQGPSRKVIDKFVIDNCFFYDSGVYDNNGRGYAWIAGKSGVAKDANPNDNLFKDFSMTNCTFLDSPRHALLSENGNLPWPANITWHIRVENNTFINFSTRTKDRLMFEMRYNPSNSTFICKNNLFVMVRKNASDTRTLYMAGMRVENGNGCVYDFADNYTTLRPDFTDDKMNKTDWGGGVSVIDYLWTSYNFSHTSRGANRKVGDVHQNIGGAEETKIKLGDTPISATDLFEDPLPKSAGGEIDMYSNYNLKGFYYKNTDKVHNHDIYKKNIGDPRWRR